MSLHFADIWEAIADAIPEAEAIVYKERRLSWGDYDKRAARVAGVLAGHGLEAGAKLSVYSYNHPAWLETQFGAFKAGLTPININYRYLDDELVYVITNSDSEALVFQAQFAPRVAAIRERLPAVKLFLEVADASGEHLRGALDYEAALAAADPQARREHPGEDTYMLYTGGTTGMPKGVMYEQRDFAPTLSAIGFALRGIETPADAAGFAALARRLHDAGAAPRSIPACPLMHGTGMWVGSMLPMALGGAVLLFDNAHFDADMLWTLAETERASEVTLVGDVFARPMLAALDAARARGRPYVLDALKMMISSGVMWSHGVKKGLLDHCPVTIIDVMGSTEGGMGSSIVTRESIDTDQTARFAMNPTTKVFDEDDREVQPGSGVVGRIANGGLVPIGYYKDEAKSAATFREIDGHRYAFTGDFATIEADGALSLLGRGSLCINSGGEKIFPEEVEEVIKTHAAVYDCLVVGVPDERFGERVTALLACAPGRAVDPGALDAHVRERIAAYKAPRGYCTVDTVPRADNGKPDYKTARSIVLTQLDMAPAGSSPCSD